MKPSRHEASAHTLKALLFKTAAESILVLFGVYFILVFGESINTQNPVWAVVWADPRADSKTPQSPGARVHADTHTQSCKRAARLSSQPYVTDEALSNLSDRHKMSRTARGAHADTGAHIHTPRAKCSSNECAQLRIIPSGRIYVFRDIQVAAEDGAKASEWSLDILTNPFKLVVSCTFATFASSQNWLFHICKLSCQIGRWHGAGWGCDGSHTETACDWIQLTPAAGGYWPFCSCCVFRSGFFTALVSHALANISPSGQQHYQDFPHHGGDSQP